MMDCGRGLRGHGLRGRAFFNRCVDGGGNGATHVFGLTFSKNLRHDWMAVGYAVAANPLWTALRNGASVLCQTSFHPDPVAASRKMRIHRSEMMRGGEQYRKRRDSVVNDNNDGAFPARYQGGPFMLFPG